MKNSCRIGKITLKQKNIRSLQIKQKPYVYNACEDMALCIRDNDLIAGYFILHKDRTTSTGFSYEAGVSDTDLLGCCEKLKQEITDRVINKT